MDKSAKMTYTLIETAVDKGIRDIRGNTRRGIRNRLTSMFAEPMG